MAAIRTDSGSHLRELTALHDTAAYAFHVANDERELTAETRALLAEITAPFDTLMDDLEGDLGDFAADLEEMI